MANHIHRYERTVLGKKNYVVFRCNLPNCTHYVNAKLVEGKETICNRCGDKMILDKRAMKFVKPYCVNCVQIRKKGADHDAILDFLKENDVLP